MFTSFSSTKANIRLLLKVLFIQSNLHFCVCTHSEHCMYFSPNCVILIINRWKPQKQNYYYYFFLNLINAEKHILGLCVQMFSSATLAQIFSTEPLQRENSSSFLCVFLCTLLFSLSTLHPLFPVLPSDNLYHFIFLRSLSSSIISASFFALLVFGTDLTTALQCGERCINTLPFFLLWKVHSLVLSEFSVWDRQSLTLLCKNTFPSHTSAHLCFAKQLCTILCNTKYIPQNAWQISKSRNGYISIYLRQSRYCYKKVWKLVRGTSHINTVQ